MLMVLILPDGRLTWKESVFAHKHEQVEPLSTGLGQKVVAW
jgi:hypothetical protein